MNYKYLSALLLSSFFTFVNVHGSIINSEFNFRQVDQFKVEVDIIIYYSGGQLNQYQRDSIYIDWGDGNINKIPRINGDDTDNNGVPDGASVSNFFTKNIYRGTYDYGNYGNFLVSTTISFRNPGIVNINFPNSENVPLYIEMEIQVMEDFENNHSPILLEQPIDFAYVDQPFVHYINAFDIDDDSVSYRLITPLWGNNLDVPLYSLPGDAINNDFTINTSTGQIIWDSPQAAGLYSILIEITSHRNGQIIDRIMRDMQINVINPENIYPSISIDTFINSFQTVQIGDTIDFSIQSQDIDPNQEIVLSSSSGLYNFYTEPALFDSTTMMNQANGTFNWIVKEEQLRKNSYQVVFKSKDNFMDIGYANFRLVRFKVVDDVVNNITLSDNDAIKVFPNPAKDYLYIESNQKIISYQIRSIENRLIQFGQLEMGSNKIDANNLNTGSYVIIFENEDRVRFSKVILIK